MTQPELPATSKKPARVVIVGVGGAGTNVLRQLAKKPVPEVRYVVCDSDQRFLGLCPPDVTAIEMREYGSHGFDGGGPAFGRRMAEDSFFKLKLKGGVKKADLVILTAGMGAGTGGGASPVIASTLRETGAFVLAFVTTPFSFEGQKRRQQAAEAVKQLGAQVDNIVVIDNERILPRLDKGATIAQSFSLVDEVTEKAILSVVQALNVPDGINIDPDGLKKVMRLPGRTLMAIGKGFNPQGPVMEAAVRALANPLNDADLSQAKGVLLSFHGGCRIGLVEYTEAMTFICRKLSPDAQLVFGVSQDREGGSPVDLTLIATGIEPPRRGLFGRRG